MSQIKRIEEMEHCLDISRQAIRTLSDAISGFQEVQPLYRKLSDYYGSSLWMQDLEDDEAGILPHDLKRGVLSEDEVYDLLTEHRAVMVQMLKIVTKSIEGEPE